MKTRPRGLGPHATFLFLVLSVIIAAPARAQTALSAWGYNGSGCLGDATFTDRSLPTGAPGFTDGVAIAGGADFTVAVRADGTAWAWGAGNYGQLGNGGTADEPEPVAIAGLAGVTRVAAGFGHALALESDGSVWAWGNNDTGQLGDGTTTTRLTPVSVLGLPNDIVTVACGRSFSFAVTSGGDLWAWGSNSTGQLGDGTTDDSATPVLIGGLPPLVDVEGGESFGRGHTLAVAADGSVWTWGANNVGQLGDGTFDGRVTPAVVSGVGPAVDIAAGLDFCLVLLTDGTVASWGGNEYGQLGDGTFTDSSVPVMVKSENGLGTLSGITAISAGVHSLAIHTSGTIRAWGYNFYGEVGDGAAADRNLPVAIGCLSGVVRIAAADYHSLALGTNTCGEAPEQLSCWGYNGDGGLGDNSLTDQSRPVHTIDMTNVQAIAGGADFSLAVRSDGTVWAWGLNVSGQVGDGTTVNAPAPVNVAGLANIVRVAAGFAHSLALESNGTVWSWGSNDTGQLGDGTTTQRLTPVSVSGLPNDVVTIACGRSFSFAVTSGGDLWAWGSNSAGQLGDGTTNDAATPVLVGGLPPIVDVEGGEWFGRGHSLAMAADGSVWTWGANNVGQLGDGTLDDRITPAVVSGIDPAVDIAAGLDFCLALLTDGTVVAWGGNEYGQLGSGSTTDSPSPILVKSEDGLGVLSGITAISAGVHSLAIRTDGTMRAWGYNFYGEIGDGAATDRVLPVPVDCLTQVTRIAAADYHSMALGVNGCAPVSGVTPSAAPGRGAFLTSVQWSGSSGATLEFELSRASNVRIDVFNVRGQRLAGIADEPFQAGTHRLRWDGRAGTGRKPAAGIYFVRLAADGVRDSRRLVIIP